MTRLGLVAALVVLGLAEVHGQSQTLAAIRAAFVVNLVEFVDWAASSTGGIRAPGARCIGRPRVRR